VTQIREAGDVRPWYRQAWPWLVMVPPAATVIGGLLTLGLALRYPEYDVRDGHYRDGLGVYRAFEAGVPAGVDASLVLLSDGRVELTVDGSLDMDPLSLWLIHPTSADQDRKVDLVSLGGGRFEGSVALPAGAYWTAALRNEAAGWQLVGRLETAGKVVRLVPSRDAGTP
jgi:hypothetical protein